MLVLTHLSLVTALCVSNFLTRISRKFNHPDLSGITPDFITIPNPDSCTVGIGNSKFIKHFWKTYLLRVQYLNFHGLPISKFIWPGTITLKTWHAKCSPYNKTPDFGQKPVGISFCFPVPCLHDLFSASKLINTYLLITALSTENTLFCIIFLW